MIPVSEPNITEKELDYVTDAVKSTMISFNGKYIDRFESMFTDYIGTKHALTVSNGTVVLRVALLALEISSGDGVIVPALTYISTANAITYTGETPVFTDSEPDTWNMCPDSIERLIIPMAIYPNVNLILNFGFNKDATHTFNKNELEVHNKKDFQLHHLDWNKKIFFEDIL